MMTMKHFARLAAPDIQNYFVVHGYLYILNIWVLSLCSKLIVLLVCYRLSVLISFLVCGLQQFVVHT